MSSSLPAPTMPFKVIIIGGGLAGTLLANGLNNHAINVQVYERLPQHTKREGYQITLGAPALAGFRACLTKERIDSIVAKFGRSGGKRSRAPVVYDREFRPLLDLTRLPGYSKSAPINRHLLRDLLAEPLDGSGILQYDRTFSYYEIVSEGRQEGERVRVHFEDGSSDICDVLIAADGNHSRVGLNNIKQVNTHWNFLVKAQLSTALVLRLPKAVLEKQALVFTDNVTMYFSESFTKENESAETSIDESLSSCMLGAALPTEMCPLDVASLSSDAILDLIASATTWATEYRDMIDMVRGSYIYAYRARVSSRPPNDWRRKARAKGPPECGHPRVWLMGDACHPMLPNRGMGGNQAMRDTATALPLLIDLSQQASEGRDMSAQIVEACTKYEDDMIPRAFEWVQKSGGETVVVSSRPA